MRPTLENMKSKLRSILFLALGICLSASVHAREILGSSESEAREWAQEKGYQVQASTKGTQGCLKERRYLPMSGKDIEIRAAFFHPVYQVDTKMVAMVEFLPSQPISKAQAETLAIQAAPIAGTRPPTHRQNIPAGSESCAPSNGGFEGRYTEDYLVEYFYASDRARIEKLRVYNENIR